MVKVLGTAILAATFCFATTAGMTEAAEKDRGEALFKQHCLSCHPDGGNIINPKKTLKKKDMEAAKVKSVDDIVKLMRNPGPGMIKFDEKTISEKDAKAIAEYILKTFK